MLLVIKDHGFHLLLPNYFFLMHIPDFSFYTYPEEKAICNTDVLIVRPDILAIIVKIFFYDFGNSKRILSSISYLNPPVNKISRTLLDFWINFYRLLAH